MPSRQSYARNYYEAGSAARKREYQYDEKKQSAVKTKKKTVANTKVKPKSKASTIILILSIFVMTMIIVYRFNVISEKNLMAQNLASDLKKAESEVLTSKIEVEQNTDLNKIEAYAKQQLGMQKPDKNQTIYIDTSKVGSSVQIQEQTKGIQKFINTITEAIKNIF